MMFRNRERMVKWMGILLAIALVLSLVVPLFSLFGN